VIDTLGGYWVRAEPYLAGSKRAVRQGRTIHVSPAMWDLMSHAGPGELERLLASIPLVVIPEYDPYSTNFFPPEFS
jgi:hypothetical protein